LTGTTSGTIPTTFTGDNGGTLILDGVGTSSSPDCYQKTNYRGDPHEWGAKGDGITDDTAAMQEWFGAYGNLFSGPPGTAPANFGPWNASIPGTYLVSSPLSCPVNATIQGPSSQFNPIFQVVASSSFQGLLETSNTMQPIVTQAVIGAHTSCRLSGVGVTGNQQVTQLMGGVSSTTTTITLASTSNIYVGNAVTDASGFIPIQPIPTSVSGVCSSSSCTGTGTPCTPTPCVVISQPATGTNSTDFLTFWGPDAVDVLGGHVTIDGFSVLSGGMHNLDCGDNGSQGTLQVKDTLLQFSTSDNAYIPGNCMDVRLVGDHFSGAGQNVGTGSSARGILYGGNEVILADGEIDGSEGVGLDIEGGSDISVTGMDIATNGVGTSGGQGIHINGATGFSICGNHFIQNDAAFFGTTAQVFFDGTNSGVLCGNSYRPDPFATTPVPQYVYDASSSASVQGVSFYENPPLQTLGVLSPGAAALLPQTQVLPAPRAYLTGLVLSNGSPSTKVNIASGSATDSTGVMVITLPRTFACTVDLGSTNKGLGYLDTGGPSVANTTYFFFAVADLSEEGAPNCIASANLSPTMNSLNVPSYGAPVYRLIGALYTTGSNTVVPFQQDGDTFYLKISVADIKTGGTPICSVGTTMGTLCQLSVPCGRTASATACPSPGFAVQAFGRIVGGSSSSTTTELLLSSLDQADQPPALFPMFAGNTNASVGTVSSTPPVFPFHLTTDGNGNVRVRASGSNVTAYEITDGWVWHRQQ
jgi:hypothetical protein